MEEVITLGKCWKIARNYEKVYEWMRRGSSAQPGTGSKN